MTTQRIATPADISAGTVVVDSIGSRWIILSDMVHASHVTAIREEDQDAASTEGTALYSRRIRIYKDGTLRHYKAEEPWTLA